MSQKVPFELYLIEDTNKNIFDPTLTTNKLLTIGSSESDLQMMAKDIKIVKKVNGEVTVTFTMYYKYIDNRTGAITPNRFVSLLHNETHIRLKVETDDASHINTSDKWDWYDLVIKDVKESSDK